MRNLSTPSHAAAARRGSSAGIGFPLASPNQSRYKGLVSTPGITKFSGWKRETEIPKYVIQKSFLCKQIIKFYLSFRVYFHDLILQKIREKPSDKVWIKDVSNGRCEVFGNVNASVNKIASGLSKLGKEIKAFEKC